MELDRNACMVVGAKTNVAVLAAGRARVVWGSTSELDARGNGATAIGAGNMVTSPRPVRLRKANGAAGAV